MIWAWLLVCLVFLINFFYQLVTKVLKLYDLILRCKIVVRIPCISLMHWNWIKETSIFIFETIGGLLLVKKVFSWCRLKEQRTLFLAKKSLFFHNLSYLLNATAKFVIFLIILLWVSLVGESSRWMPYPFRVSQHSLCRIFIFISATTRLTAIANSNEEISYPDIVLTHHSMTSAVLCQGQMHFWGRAFHLRWISRRRDDHLAWAWL